MSAPTHADVVALMRALHAAGWTHAADWRAGWDDTRLGWDHQWRRGSQEITIAIDEDGKPWEWLRWTRDVEDENPGDVAVSMRVAARDWSIVLAMADALNVTTPCDEQRIGLRPTVEVTR